MNCAIQSKLFPAIMLILTTGATVAAAAKPTAQQALGLRPIQADVDFETPQGEQLEKCTLQSETQDNASGWVVRDEAGRVLRKFLDTNDDNRIDRWCYYKNGIEVYRDIDVDFNGKADQYRWLGTAGSRWGLDKNEDGRIDIWKSLSPEEASAEVIAAMKDGDLARFKTVLITEAEIDQLGLSTDQTASMRKSVAEAATAFTASIAKQGVTNETNWLHFGAVKPGVVPAGSNSSTKDVTVYDSTAAMIETAGEAGQVNIGSMVKVDEAWRVIDAPGSDGGFFFHDPLVARPEFDLAAIGGISEDVQEQIREFERVEQSLASATSQADKLQLHERRCDILDKIVAGIRTDEDRSNWVRQYADTVSAAAQTGEFPGGPKRLEQLYLRLARSPSLKDDAAFVKFRQITADYTLAMSAREPDFAKIQSKWMDDLETFVKKHSDTPDAAEAMLQLGLALEFVGKEDEAKKWYQRIASEYPEADIAVKAGGAARRIDAVGKRLALKGQTADGQAFDIARYRGRIVLVHYWATWCDMCKKDMVTFRSLQAKYGAKGFAVVGVNLDTESDTFADFMRANRIPWPQLYAPGGLESRYANEMGILTLPAMFLIDKDGTVISRNIQAAELDEELGKRLK